jgi:hypothetical protein
VLTSIAVTPASPVSVVASGTQTFTANALDQFGATLATQPTFTWSIVSGGAGSINSSTGVYTASGTVGSTATVTAAAGGISASDAVITVQAPVALTGTPIGTPGSYGNDGSTIANVFDGNLNTFFDAPNPGTSGAPDWVGLDLGAAYTIATITYAPRETGDSTQFESRMVGGYFQASNDPTFTTGDVTLAGPITSIPPDGYTTIPSTATGSYRYVRYVAPAGGYGNIAELSFTGTPAVTTPAWLSPTSAAMWNPTTGVLTVTGPTIIDADPGSAEPIIQASGASAVVTLDPSSGTDIHIGGLSLANGASAVVTSLGTPRSATNYHILVIGVAGATTAPTYTIDATSTLDLADNDMAILYGSGSSPMSSVTAQLASAYDGGAWDKPGLTSSVARSNSSAYGLGYAEASTLGLTSFDGVTLGGNAVLVKYTLLGDTQLRGAVGIGDYGTVLSDYGTAQGWTGGDFHYGGNVGLGDYDDLLSNYGNAAFS